MSVQVGSEGEEAAGRVNTVETLRREIRHAARGMGRNPGFTLIVLVTLALGIGATTAIFTMLDGVVLRPLPYAESDRLVWLDSPTPAVKADAPPWGLSVAEFFYFKKNAYTLQNIGTYQSTEVTVAGAQSAERVPAAVVSASVFDVLGLRPALGRTLMPKDNLRHAAPVTVLGYDYWTQHFNGNTNVIGSVVNIEATPVQIVGVMQRGASVPDARSQQVDLWIPQGLDPSAQPVNSHYLQAVARLAPGASAASAQAELLSFIGRLPDLFPTAYSPSFLKQTGFTVETIPLRTHVIGDIAARLWVLLGAVALVLIIACANVANLFLVRTEGRNREVAIRSALGAKRGDLAWQYLTESMLLALFAGAVAFSLAFVGLRMMVALAPADLPRLTEIHLGWTSVLFTVVISVAAGAVFGLLALASAAQPAQDTTILREGGRGMTSSRRQHFARGVLVAAQTALALILLAGAGLMLQSVRNLRNVSPGFDSTGVLTA
ncbi:MAG: ABC transporter permease, partial [Gemmatimonadaceae bacterium]